MEGMEEAEAFRDWRAGKPGAFDRLYAIASPGLAATCRKLARDEGSAGDLFQEAWRQGLAEVDSFRGEGSWAGWLSAIARNLWRRGLERRRTGDRILGEIRTGLKEETPPSLGEAADVREAMARLPPDQREAVILYYVNGLSLREAAKTLGVSHVTVGERLKKGAAQLERELGDP